ncbi:hypothetical protein RV18_GL003289 [Enterococcus termitis]|nr:hypothetical protein RV18_GL003289 [Enterococcus termitis]
MNSFFHEKAVKGKRFIMLFLNHSMCIKNLLMNKKSCFSFPIKLRTTLHQTKL